MYPRKYCPCLAAPQRLFHWTAAPYHREKSQHPPEDPSTRAIPFQTDTSRKASLPNPPFVAVSVRVEPVLARMLLTSPCTLRGCEATRHVVTASGCPWEREAAKVLVLQTSAYEVLTELLSWRKRTRLSTQVKAKDSIYISPRNTRRSISL